MNGWLLLNRQSDGFSKWLKGKQIRIFDGQYNRTWCEMSWLSVRWVENPVEVVTWDPGALPYEWLCFVLEPECEPEAFSLMYVKPENPRAIRAAGLSVSTKATRFKRKNPYLWFEKDEFRSAA